MRSTTPGIIRRQYATTPVELVVKRDGADVTVKAVVCSTDGADRYDDVVDQASWKLERFKANPVGPWCHDSSEPPVCNWATDTLGVRMVGAQLSLVAEPVWYDSPLYPKSQIVADQWRRGFLKAVSVGFLPGKGVRRSALPTDHPAYSASGYGMFYSDCELLEISPVVIPANADALGMDQPAAKGLDMAGAVADELIRRLDIRPDGPAFPWKRRP